MYGIVTSGARWWYIMFTSEKKGIYTTFSTSGDYIPLGTKILENDTDLKRGVKNVVSTIA